VGLGRLDVERSRKNEGTPHFASLPLSSLPPSLLPSLLPFLLFQITTSNSSSSFSSSVAAAGVGVGVGDGTAAGLHPPPSEAPIPRGNGGEDGKHSTSLIDVRAGGVKIVKVGR